MKYEKKKKKTKKQKLAKNVFKLHRDNCVTTVITVFA